MNDVEIITRRIMAKAKEEPPVELQPPDDDRVDYRTDPNYGIDNYFQPIDEGLPFVTYYMLKANLAVPIRPELISQKSKGWDKTKNQAISIDYVNVTDLKDLLDERVGVWTSEITNVITTAAELLVVVRLTIHASDGDFSQDGSGAEWLGHTGFGDTFSNAYAQAFRRACEGHGLGRQLWRKTEVHENELNMEDGTEQPHHTQVRPPADPVARSLGDMLTSKQLGFIRSVSKEANIDADAECKRLLNCNIDELSKRAASDFIDHLTTLARSSGANNQMPSHSGSQDVRPNDSQATREFMNLPDSSAASGPPASQKQKDYIQNICSDKGKNEHLMALDLFKCEFNDISKAQASKMIEELIGKKN